MKRQERKRGGLKALIPKTKRGSRKRWKKRKTPQRKQQKRRLLTAKQETDNFDWIAESENTFVAEAETELVLAPRPLLYVGTSSIVSGPMATPNSAMATSSATHAALLPFRRGSFSPPVQHGR
jgi:hypothetical protein